MCDALLVIIIITIIPWQLVQLRVVVRVKRKQRHRGEWRVRLDPAGQVVLILMVAILNRHARSHSTRS